MGLQLPAQGTLFLKCDCPVRPNRSVDHNTSVVYAWFNELPPTPKVAQKTGMHLSRTPSRQRSYHRPAWRPHDAATNAQRSQRIGTQACGKNNERFGARLMLRYPIQLEDDDDAVLATSPDFPELTTFGVDRDEAVARAAYALEEAIAARIHGGKDVPSVFRRSRSMPCCPCSPRSR